MSPNQPRDFLAQGLAELAQARRHLDYYSKSQVRERGIGRFYWIKGASIRLTNLRLTVLFLSTTGCASGQRGRSHEALGYCLEQKPLLDAICERVVAYAQRIQ